MMNLVSCYLSSVHARFFREEINSRRTEKLSRFEALLVATLSLEKCRLLVAACSCKISSECVLIHNRIKNKLVLFLGATDFSTSRIRCDGIASIVQIAIVHEQLNIEFSRKRFRRRRSYITCCFRVSCFAALPVARISVCRPLY